MDYEKNRLTLLPHEINMLSDADGRQGQHPRDLSLNRIFNAANTSMGVLRAHSGLSLPEPERVVRLGGQAIREVPRTLAALAREELAHEQELQGQWPELHTEGALAVRRKLSEDLDALVANPRRVVLEVSCSDYPETSK